MLEYPAELLAEGAALPPGLETRLAQEGETLTPDLALLDPDNKQPVLLVTTLPANQALNKALAGARWKASPATRMMTLLHATGVPLGLVTNGEEWMVVHAPRNETAGFVSWYADLWREEPITLRAFRSLLGVRRFFGVEAKDRLLALWAESAQDQQEVTQQLGYQVRRAVEVLVQAIDRIDKDRDRELLRHVSEQQLYKAALSVMMRLVFLFSAEERKLLLLGQPLYDAHYAVSTLGPQLREEADRHGEEVLERRFDAWARLLATFRAVHGGVSHDLLPLPAYGGALFDPDRYPFLEGRGPGTSWRAVPAEPLPINNRTALHLLEALQYLEMRIPGGGAERRKLSFRALGIEQIGHVYEGLLDHTAKRASEPVLGLAGAKGQEPEIPLAALEAERAKGEPTLVAMLAEQTKRSERALARALTGDLTLDMGRLRAACDNDDTLLDRVRPFAGLLRTDSHGDPVVILPGSVYVTEGTDRRSTGTHYTPTSLTEPIVRHALDPLVYRGMADGVPPTPETLIGPEEILALKVVDFACGSGAFLVQACRYLAAKLVEAWERQEQAQPGVVLKVPEAAAASGAPAERLLPKETEERLAIARRLIADRCLYGVDKNAQAVEMAKLSLWLITLQKDRPFEFLDHAIKGGDTLLGVTSVAQLTAFHIDPECGRELFAKQPDLFDDVTAAIERALSDAAGRRRRLESFTVNDIRDAEEKARLHGEAERALSGVRLIGDLIIGAAIAHAGRPKQRDAELQALAPLVAQAFEATTGEALRRKLTHELRHRAQTLLNQGKPARQPPRRCQHWPVEFPEVFATGGFDALISNPPFQGGTIISGEHGKDLQEHLKHHLATVRSGGRADLCAYFFLRGAQILKRGGGFGMLATNTIAQGDTREVGLDAMAKDGATVYRAVPSRRWPGTANLEVAHVWCRRGRWQAPFALDDRPVEGITPFLGAPGKVGGEPYRLKANAGKSFEGSKLDGMGFVMMPAEAQKLIARDLRNKDVLFPYLNGEDLNSRPDQSPSRWVINFFDWPLDRSAAGRWAKGSAKEHKDWLRQGRVPGDYPDPVAADYPDCLAIVETKVKPQRASHSEARTRHCWWRFQRLRPELYATIAGLERVFVAVQTSKFLSISGQPTNIVFSHMTVVFAVDDYANFAVLNASWHTEWILERCSKLETRLRYIPTDGFETFPFPNQSEQLSEFGERYCDMRKLVMLKRREGFTATYNHFHEPDETSSDIAGLRELHVEMDKAVAAAYGWDDLALGHGFHPTKQGVRFTLSEAARAEVFDRLLALNHQRYAEEVAQGLHDKDKKKPTKAKPKPAAGKPVQPDLDLGFELT